MQKKGSKEKFCTGRKHSKLEHQVREGIASVCTLFSDLYCTMTKNMLIGLLLTNTQHLPWDTWLQHPGAELSATSRKVSLPLLQLDSLTCRSPLHAHSIASRRQQRNTLPIQSHLEIPGFYVVIPAGDAQAGTVTRGRHPKFLLDVTLQAVASSKPPGRQGPTASPHRCKLSRGRGRPRSRQEPSVTSSLM